MESHASQWLELVVPKADSLEHGRLIEACHRYASIDGDGSFDGDAHRAGLKSTIVNFLVRNGRAHIDDVRQYIIEQRRRWDNETEWVFRAAWRDIVRLLREWIDTDIGWWNPPATA